MDVPSAAAASILLFAGLQLLLSSWRDLGPATVICAGIAALLAPGPLVQGAVALGALLAALSWARGARFGVGQLPYTGLALALVLTALALAPLLEGRLPQPRLVLASAEGGLGALLVVMALRTPSSGRPRVRWKGDIPVTEGSAPAPSRSPPPAAG